MKTLSGWKKIKKQGLHGLPSGEVSKIALNLLESLADLNIFVVPVGELESFCKSVPNHGPAWVSEVITKNLSHDRELDMARKFVNKVFEL